MTVTNNSKAARSYQVVPIGHPCSSGAVYENGWVEAGEVKVETFRGPNQGLAARFCIDLQPEGVMQFEEGQEAQLRLTADPDDRADV